MNKLNKKIFISLGLSMVVAMPIISTIACSSDNSITNIEKDVTGEDVLTIDLSTATQAQAQAILAKQSEFDRVAGKHYALIITSKSTPSKTAKMVYAYKTVEQGYNANATDPRTNSIEASSTGYKGYSHKINGVSWEHDMSYYPLHTQLKQVADGSYGYTNITGTNVLNANVDGMTQEEARVITSQVNEWKVTMGKHFAVTVTKGTKTATMVYAIKSEEEGYMDDVDNDKRVEFNEDNTGYVGYKHRVNGANWTLNVAYYALYNEVLAIAGENLESVPPVTEDPNDPEAPVVERVLTEDEIIDVVMADEMTPELKVQYEEAVYKQAAWSASVTTNAGRHFAVRITKGAQVATMVYAYKTIAEGYVNGNSDNLLGFDGTQYAGYDHKINGVSWHHGFLYYDLWREVKAQAATIVRPADIYSGVVATMTKAEAQAIIATRNQRLKVEGDIFAISLKQAPTSVASTLVFVVKTATQGFNPNPTNEDEYIGNADRATKKYIRLQFVVDGNYTDWKHDSNFYPLWGQVVAKANAPETK